MNKLTHLLSLGVSYKLKRTRPLNPPYQFSIEPTNVCNFKCTFCPQSGPDHLHSRKQGFLSAENLQMFLKQIREIRPGNRNISLTLDGEPTLNKHLPEFINMINAEGLMPRFSSNAMKLTPELFDELVYAGSFLISVDFASEAGYFEHIRSKKGDFAVLQENISYMIAIAKRNPRIKLELVDISHFSGADPDSSLRKLKDLFGNDLPRNITFRSREFHNFCGHLENKPREKYKLCPYPWTSFNVTWEGDVVPCCRDTQARTVLGSTLNDSIMDIWYGEKFQSLRKKLVTKDVIHIGACKDCDLPWSSGSKRWSFKYMLSSLIRR